MGEEKDKCWMCGNMKEVNDFGICEDCWNFVLRAQNITYGGKGENPFK